MKKIRCVILLATYNGEKYIIEQINSIKKQKDVHTTVFVSDDMSTDSTLEILQSFKDDKFVLLDNVGRMGSASQNFFRLIRDVDFVDYDYIAFADQDDIWHEDKLARAIKEISEKGLGGYSSNVTAFWENGDKQVIEKSDPQKEFDFLFGSPGPGCTQVFTSEFLQDFKKTLINKDVLAKKIDLHDWLVYAYARTHNYKWWIDSKPTMDYRQHENNEFGANSGLKTFLSRWRKAREGWYGKQILTIASFCEVEESKPILYLVSSSYIDKVKLAFMSLRLRRKKSEAFVLALMLIIPGFKV
jgi:rhamnosyltransferase